MFCASRIEKALEPLGFFTAFESDNTFSFVRANTRVGLFEAIEPCAGKHRGGRWGDIACASVSISLTPGYFTSTKGIAESECLSDSAPTKTKAQAIDWERLVVESGPAKLEALIRERGHALLARTQESRVAVEKYLALLDRRLSIEQQITNLTESATDVELKEARRLSRTEGFILLPERPCYDLISLHITLRAQEVEGDKIRFWGKSPNDVPELNWRFQLLASRLYPERGWNDFEKCAAAYQSAACLVKAQ